MADKKHKSGAATPSGAIFNDPDVQNLEQSEAGTQAQDVAADAMAVDLDGIEPSEHGGKSNPAQLLPDDYVDLIDKLTEMRRTGRIDMDAFEGEEPMDDEKGE